MHPVTKNIIVCLALFLFTPIGLLLMWFWVKWPLWIKLLVTVLLLLPLLLVFIYLYVAQPYKVSGSGMNPDFVNGQSIIAKRLAFDQTPIQRGEVVVFESPTNNINTFIKRVVGLPNETIRIENGEIYINDQLLDESYLPEHQLTSTGSYLSDGQAITIPDNYYFLIGDNRVASSDSREFGPISKDKILGRLWFKY
jgi:signal peptidase I